MSLLDLLPKKLSTSPDGEFLPKETGFKSLLTKTPPSEPLSDITPTLKSFLKGLFTGESYPEELKVYNQKFKERLEAHPEEAKAAKFLIFPAWETIQGIKSNIVSRIKSEPIEFWKDKSIREIPEVDKYLTSEAYTDTFKNILRAGAKLSFYTPTSLLYNIPKDIKSNLYKKIDNLTPNQIANITEGSADILALGALEGGIGLFEKYMSKEPILSGKTTLAPEIRLEGKGYSAEQIKSIEKVQDVINDLADEGIENPFSYAVRSRKKFNITIPEFNLWKGATSTETATMFGAGLPVPRRVSYPSEGGYAFGDLIAKEVGFGIIKTALGKQIKIPLSEIVEQEEISEVAEGPIFRRGTQFWAGERPLGKEEGLLTFIKESKANNWSPQEIFKSNITKYYGGKQPHKPLAWGEFQIIWEKATGETIQPIPTPVKAEKALTITPEVEISDITPVFIDKTINKFKPITGFDKLLRKQIGKAEWDKMSNEEKIAEIKEYARKDLEIAIEEAKTHPMGPIDYLVDRILDPLDPMNEIYGEFLRQLGAKVEAGKSIKLPEKAKIRVAPTGRLITKKEVPPEEVEEIEVGKPIAGFIKLPDGSFATDTAENRVLAKRLMREAPVKKPIPTELPKEVTPPTITPLKDQQIINTVSLAIPKKSSLPILQNIVIDGKQLRATDLDMTIIYESDKDMGQATVPADALRGVSLDQIQVKNKKGLVQIGNTQIQGTPVSEAPQIPEVKVDKTISIPAGNFLQELQKAVVFTSTDETRYVLQGVKIEVAPNNIKFVSTDGRRLYIRDLPIKAGKTFNALLNAEQIKKINKVMRSVAPSDIEFSIDKKSENYKMKIGDFTVTGRLIEGEFPKYEQVIPKKAKSNYLIPKEELANALNKIPKNLITRDSLHINLKFDKGKLILSKEIPEVGKWSETINAKPIKPEGVVTHVLLPMASDIKNIDVAFNLEYLKDIVKTQVSDIQIGIEEREKPAIFYEPKSDAKPITIEQITPMRSPIMRARMAGEPSGFRQVRTDMKADADERLLILKDQIQAQINITKEKLAGKITRLEEEAKLKIEEKKTARRERIALERVKREEKIKEIKAGEVTKVAEARQRAKLKLKEIQERLKEKKVVARKTAEERAKLSRILLQKERGELLNEIGRRISEKSLNPFQFKNLMLKEFQVTSPMGLSNRELRRLIKAMEGRREELSIPVYPSEKEILDTAEKEQGKYPIPGFKTINNFRRYGPSGSAIANKIELHEKNRLQYSGYGINHVHKISKLIGGPSKWSRFVSIIEGEIEPVTNEEKEALRLYNEVAEFYADKAEKLEIDTRDTAGFLRKFRPRQNWWPRKYDRTDLEKEEFKKKAIQHIMAQQNIDEARATEMYEVFRKDLKSAQFGHIERSRELDLEGYRRDMGVIIEYITGAANRLSWVEQFGKDIFIGVGKGFEPERLVELMGRLPDKLTFPGLPPVYPRQEVRKIIERMNPRPKVDALTQWSQRARTIQVIKLAFAQIPNAFQWFTNTWPKVGTKNMIIGLWNRILSKKATDFAEISGATGSHRAMEMAEVQRIGILGKMAELFLKLTAFSSTEINNRILSSLPGSKYAQDIANKLMISQGTGLRAAWYRWRTPYLREELKKMFLDPDEVLKHGLSEQNLKDAGYAISLITQFSARPGYIPSTWSSEGGRLTTQFKNFAYNQSALLWNEALKPFIDFIGSKGRRGNLNLFMYMIAIPIAGAVVTKIKEKIYRKKILDEDRPLYLKMLVWAMQVGGFGIAADALFAMEYGEKGIYSFLGGPTISDIVYTIANLYRTGKNIADDEMEKAILSLTQIASSYSPLFRVAMERGYKLVGETRDMMRISNLIQDTRKQYIKLMTEGKEERAYKLWENLDTKYSDEYFEKYGKILIPPTLKEVFKREIEKETPLLERRRKMLPGKGVKGFEYLKKPVEEKGFRVLMK